MAHKDAAEVKQAVVDEMKLVIPHVKPVHLKQCQDMLERPSILGAKYKVPVGGQFLPSIPHSCIEQGRGAGLGWEGERKVVVFVAGMDKVAGAYGTDWTLSQGECIFSMKKGDTEITVRTGPIKTSMNSICRQL